MSFLGLNPKFLQFYNYSYAAKGLGAGVAYAANEAALPEEPKPITTKNTLELDLAKLDLKHAPHNAQDPNGPRQTPLTQDDIKKQFEVTYPEGTEIPTNENGEPILYRHAGKSGNDGAPMSQKDIEDLTALVNMSGAQRAEFLGNREIEVAKNNAEITDIRTKRDAVNKLFTDPFEKFGQAITDSNYIDRKENENRQIVPRSEDRRASKGS